MKKVFLFASAAIALLASCSSEDNLSNVPTNEGKERIALSAGDGQIMTTRAGFTNDTRIVARIVSDKRDDSETKCVKTVLTAVAEQDSKGYSNVAYASSDYVRYWDDAHGRNSRLSVYAVAIPNKSSYVEESVTKFYVNEEMLSGSNTWATDNANTNTITWTVATTQTSSDLAEQDLTYSNNIQETGDRGVYSWDYTEGKYPEPEFADGKMNATRHEYTDEGTKYDGRLYFTQQGKTINQDVTTDPGHFDKGQMEFNHALTRIQVNLVKGDGYDGAAFSVTDIQLLGQSVTGTFDIKNASWSDKGAATAVKMAAITTKADKAATYEAQMLPGYTFANNATNVLQLTVSGNTYYITNAQLRTALNGKVAGDDYSTKMGNRYIFDIKVAKSKIQNITATIIPWNEVTAVTTTVDNSHLTFSFYNNNNYCDGNVYLYKYEQALDNVYTNDGYTADPTANTAYTGVALTADGEHKYKTSEYYNDNKTAYHFRSTNVAALDDGNKTFTMTSGAVSATNDYHWGAPMTKGASTSEISGGTLPYDDENGFLDNIAKGIVAASKESQINLTEVHMMSQLVVKLTTPATGGVVLDGAEVKVTKFSKTGTVDMGSGKITPNTTSDATNGIGDSGFIGVTETDGVYSCTINVVPQDLVRNSGVSDGDYVGITIKTTDSNEYYIVKKLSDIVGTAGTQITNLQTAGKITTWYPGHKYTYTFNIKKKEIEVITATIVPWNDVKGTNTDLDLEK